MNKISLFKPQYAKLLLAFFLTVLSSHTIYADDLEIDGIYYNVNEDGTSVTVTSGDNKYSGDVVIPSTIKVGSTKTLDVTAIGDYAFFGCSSLTSIFIPEGITSIGDYAFSNCTSLITVSIPESVTEIGNSAFRNCSSLTSISIPEGVTSIGDYTFRSCSSLTSISIPEGVTSIGDHAFYICSSLALIICYAEEVPYISSNTTFSGIPSSATLFVPEFAIENYKADRYWNQFGQILAIGAGIELSVGEVGLATYCAINASLDLSEAESIAAYRATVEDNTVILTRAYQVHAGEGVLLRSLNGGATTENVNIATGPIEEEPNDFVGVLEDSKWLMEKDREGNTNFVLSRQEDGTVGFYKADFTQVTKGKAYLPVPNYSPSTAEVKGLRLVFDDGTATTIDIADAQQTEAGGAYYTLSGVKVESPTQKGIYIRNGKKYIVK